MTVRTLNSRHETGNLSQPQALDSISQQHTAPSGGQMLPKIAINDELIRSAPSADDVLRSTILGMPVHDCAISMTGGIIVGLKGAFTACMGTALAGGK